MYSRAACRYLLWERSGIETTPPPPATQLCTWLEAGRKAETGRDTQGRCFTFLFLDSKLTLGNNRPNVSEQPAKLPAVTDT